MKTFKNNVEWKYAFCGYFGDEFNIIKLYLNIMALSFTRNIQRNFIVSTFTETSLNKLILRQEKRKDEVLDIECTQNCVVYFAKCENCEYTLTPTQKPTKIVIGELINQEVAI